MDNKQDKAANSMHSKEERATVIERTEAKLGNSRNAPIKKPTEEEANNAEEAEEAKAGAYSINYHFNSVTNDVFITVRDPSSEENEQTNASKRIGSNTESLVTIQSSKDPRTQYSYEIDEMCDYDDIDKFVNEEIRFNGAPKPSNDENISGNRYTRHHFFENFRHMQEANTWTECLYLRHWKPPYLAFTLSLIQIYIYFSASAAVKELLLYNPNKKSDIWRFFSYSLLHSNKIHLACNIIIQLLASFFLETEQGYLRVSTVFLGSALAGSLATSIFQPKLYMIGASAGVYGLLMSQIPHLKYNFYAVTFCYSRIIAVIVLFTSDMTYSLYHSVYNSNMNPQIGLIAHLAGAIAGILLGFSIYKYDDYSVKASIFLIRLLAIIAYLGFIFIASFLSFFFTLYP